MRKVVYRPAAIEDLRAIAHYIADDNPSRALSFVDELQSVAQVTAERPASFPARPDLAEGLRVTRHGRYLLFFLYSEDQVEIVRVLHGARDLGNAFSQAEE